jgi:hypothetical protein
MSFSRAVLGRTVGCAASLMLLLAASPSVLAEDTPANRTAEPVAEVSAGAPVQSPDEVTIQNADAILMAYAKFDQKALTPADHKIIARAIDASMAALMLQDLERQAAAAAANQEAEQVIEPPQPAPRAQTDRTPRARAAQAERTPSLADEAAPQSGAERQAARRFSAASPRRRGAPEPRTTREPPAKPVEVQQAQKPTKEQAEAGCAKAPPGGLEPTPPDQPQPEFVAENPKIRLENVWKGDSAIGTFKIKNTGAGPLAIRLKGG